MVTLPMKIRAAHYLYPMYELGTTCLQTQETVISAARELCGQVLHTRSRNADGVSIEKPMRTTLPRRKGSVQGMVECPAFYVPKLVGETVKERKHTLEQIVSLLRLIAVAVGNGNTTMVASSRIGAQADLSGPDGERGTDEPQQQRRPEGR